MAAGNFVTGVVWLSLSAPCAWRLHLKSAPKIKIVSVVYLQHSFLGHSVFPVNLIFTEGARVRGLSHGCSSLKRGIPVAPPCRK